MDGWWCVYLYLEGSDLHGVWAWFCRGWGLCIEAELNLVPHQLAASSLSDETGPFRTTLLLPSYTRGPCQHEPFTLRQCKHDSTDVGYFEPCENKKRESVCAQYIHFPTLQDNTDQYNIMDTVTFVSIQDDDIVSIQKRPMILTVVGLRERAYWSIQSRCHVIFPLLTSAVLDSNLEYLIHTRV